MCLVYSETHERNSEPDPYLYTKVINLGENDQVIWMSVLQHTDTSAEQREVFIQASRARRRLETRDKDAWKQEDLDRDRERAKALENQEFQKMFSRLLRNNPSKPMSRLIIY